MFIEPGTRRKRQKADTRARILDVARARLEAVGFDATSIRDVAKEAGVAPGTVLSHFPDKQDLLHAALFEDLGEVWQRTKRRAAGRALDVELGAIARAFYAFYAARPALSRALLRESLFAAPPWSARFAAQVADVHVHVAMLARAAQERGEIARSIEVDVLGAAFLSFYYFALLAWVQGSHADPSRLFRRLLAQHLAPHVLQPRMSASPARRGTPRKAGTKGIP